MQESMTRNVSQEHVGAIEEKLKVENQFKGGANWFFWIAILSLINSIILLVGGGWSFIVGLGITQIIDIFAATIAYEIGSDIGTIVMIVAFFIDTCIAGFFVIFGVLARKGYKWSFIVGMILYALDGLLFLIVQDFLSIGFHAFALFGLYSGLKAHNRLSEMEKPRQYSVQHT